MQANPEAPSTRTTRANPSRSTATTTAAGTGTSALPRVEAARTPSQAERQPPLEELALVPRTVSPDRLAQALALALVLVRQQHHQMDPHGLAAAAPLVTLRGTTIMTREQNLVMTTSITALPVKLPVPRRPARKSAVVQLSRLCSVQGGCRPLMLSWLALLW